MKIRINEIVKRQNIIAVTIDDYYVANVEIAKNICRISPEPYKSNIKSWLMGLDDEPCLDEAERHLFFMEPSLIQNVKRKSAMDEPTEKELFEMRKSNIVRLKYNIVRGDFNVNVPKK